MVSVHASMANFPEPGEVESIGLGSSSVEETQSTFLDAYTTMATEALGLLRAKSRQAMSLRFFVNGFGLAMLLYLVVAAFTVLQFSTAVPSPTP